MGRAINLKADPSLLDDFEGTVVLRADIGGKPTRVQILLNAADYKKACDAHRDGKTVEVTGLLHREPNCTTFCRRKTFLLFRISNSPRRQTMTRPRVLIEQ